MQREDTWTCGIWDRGDGDDCYCDGGSELQPKEQSLRFVVPSQTPQQERAVWGWIIGAGCEGDFLDELGKPRAFADIGHVVREDCCGIWGEADGCRFLPLIPNFSQPAPYDKDAIEAGKKASLGMLDALETRLEPGNHLVGNGMTLADIFVAIFVTRGLQWVLGEEWRKRHPAIMRHVEMVMEWTPVRSVIDEFIMIKEETPNVNPNQV